MKTSTVVATTVRESRRLDAGFFLSPGVAARARIAMLRETGLRTKLIGEVGSVAPGSRTKRLYAGVGEPGTPYLRPYDVFDYLPQSADTLVADSTSHLMKPLVGTILQTCSGRNLGPLAYADRYLAGFAVSDDMLRLSIPDMATRMYVLTFLSTETGQALLRGNKTGGVIDHLSSADLLSLEFPLLDEKTFEAVSSKMAAAVAARETARLTLASAIADLNESLPPLHREGRLKDGFTRRASDLAGRLDVAFYDPAVAKARRDLIAMGGSSCRSFATALMPPRYVRVYVEKGHGRPVISGRQLGQTNLVNLRYLADHSIDLPAYEIQEGWTVFGGEGRAEERLGLPTMVTRERAGWLASEHVMRVIPNSDVDGGWLFLAFACDLVQAQVKSIPCGSVIDELQPQDLLDVVLPPYSEERGSTVRGAWDQLDAANRLEDEARGLLDEAILTAGF